LEKVKYEKGALETTLKDVLTEKELEIIIWKFRYLDLFFVPTTKRVLEWFTIFTDGTSKTNYHESWKSTVTDPNQRNVMLNVLLQNGLLVDDEGNIKITHVGELFVQHTKEAVTIPPLPPPPLPPPLSLGSIRPASTT
jgi:hypothetical protein